MDYPLGSFPRFGHQEVWAQERRARALKNSAITRKRKATQHLNVEIAFYNWLTQVVNAIRPQNEEGTRIIAAIHKKLARIRMQLEGGKRVYFKCLGRLLHTIAISANVFPELHHRDEKLLARTAECIGEDQLFKLQ